jgi:hypothetical protein
MARKAHFSRHALARIGERAKLDYFTIADMLDFDGGVYIGSEFVFDRKHYLIYSEPDDCCFVVIQDDLSGLVITVLPLDYHENLAWSVNEELIQEAVCKASTFVSVKENESKEDPTIIIVKVRYRADNGYLMTKNLTKYKAKDYRSDLFKVLKDKAFESDVFYHCKKKGLNANKIHGVILTLGGDGEPLIIDWDMDPTSKPSVDPEYLYDSN